MKFWVEEVGGSHVGHRSKNISFYIAIFGMKVSHETLDLLSLQVLLGTTKVAG